MTLFVYKVRLTSKYFDLSKMDESTQEVFAAHAKYLQEGIQSGLVVFAGRSDTDPKDNFGIVLFKAKDLTEAIQFAGADPVVKGGIMTVEVYPFRLFKVTDEAKAFSLW